MKNVHVLSTGKPSRLLRGIEGIRLFEEEVSPDNGRCVNVNICITSDEEIKEGDPRINNYQRKLKGEEIPSKKIIMTTDQDLIKDGVQAIDDEFLEWFVKNPSCEGVEIKDYMKVVGVETDANGYREMDVLKRIYKIIIPKEEPKQIKCYCGHTITCDCGSEQEIPNYNMKQEIIAEMERLEEPKQDAINYSLNAFKVPKEYFGKEEPKQETPEEASEILYPRQKPNSYYGNIELLQQEAFEEGAKWQQERSYSEEDMKIAFGTMSTNWICFEEFIKQFKNK